MMIREMQFSDYEQISKIAMQNNLNIYNYHDWKNLWLMNPFYKKNNINWIKGWVIEIENKIVGFLGNFLLSAIFIIPSKFSRINFGINFAIFILINLKN